MENLKETPAKSVVLTQEENEKAIIQIIEDHIVFTRLCSGMHTILNVYDPNKTTHELKAKYSGINSAFIIMGIKEEDLEIELDNAFYDCVCVTENDLVSVPELAKTIYMKWLNVIKNYFLTKKAA